MAADFRRIIVARRGDRTLNFYCNSCQLAAFGSKLQTAVDEDLRSCRTRTWILQSGDGQPAEAGRLTVCECLGQVNDGFFSLLATNKRICPQGAVLSSSLAGSRQVVTVSKLHHNTVLLGIDVTVILQLVCEVIKSSRMSVNMD